jgi:hypothetical protein
MIIWDLDQDDAYSVGIRDPHLHQPPRLLARLAEYWHPSVKQPLILALQVTDLDPDRHGVSRSIGRPSADFQMPVAQEEHQSRCVTAAELTVDR